MPEEAVDLAIKHRIVNLIPLICFLATLLVTPSVSFEPIHWIRLVILSTGAFACFFILLTSSNLKKSANNSSPNALLLIIIFIFGSFISWIIRSDKSAVFWGSSGRANGFLTYLSLALLCAIAILVSSGEFIRKFLQFFAVSGYLLLGYMTIQYMGLDPIPWSGYDTFGNLGNINFSSGFIGMWMASQLIFLKEAVKLKKKSSYFICLTILWAGFLVFESGSLQGLLGLALFVFVLLPKVLMKKRISFRYFVGIFILNIVGLLTFIFATTKRTFAGGLLFQDTMEYRRDYWVAAKNIILSNPIIGIGFDQYGLFYRSSRDSTAAFRTNVNRVSDSAHSVLLDITTSVGILFGLVFLVIIVMAIRNSIRIIYSNKNPYWLACVGIFISYLPQYIIGINHIALGIWTWVSMGAILGFKLSFTEDERVKKKVKSELPNSIPAKSFISGVIGASVGLLLAVPAFFADANYKTSYEKRDLNQMREIAFGFGGNRYLAERTLEASTNSGDDGTLSLSIAEQVTSRYPRGDYAWRILYDLRVTPDSMREIAALKVKELDPYLYQEFLERK